MEHAVSRGRNQLLWESRIEVKLTTHTEYKKRALKSPALRKALAEPDDDPFLDVAYRLITLRDELGLTQAQLAKKIGISQQALARLESPHYKGHSLQSLNRIAQACGKLLQIRFVSPYAPARATYQSVKKLTSS